MKLRTLFAAAAVAAVAVSCARVSAVTRISGTVSIDGLDEVNVLVPQLEIDTLVPVVNGRFSVEIPVDVTTFATVSAGDYGVQFIPDGTHLKVKLSEGESYVKSAAKHVQRDFSAYNAKVADIQERLTAEMTAIKEDASLSDEEAESRMDAAYDAIMDEYDRLNRKYFDRNKDNAVGLMTLQALSGTAEDEDMAELIASLPEPVRANHYVQTLQQGIDARRGTAEGAMFTDFTIADSDGKTVNFSDFVGNGKYVLVDFWASWCGPCRREIPNIAKVYEKYHGDNFDVLSVAVWDDPADTEFAAKKHGVVWSQIVNAQSVPTAIYGIEGIPHIMLIGPDGRILKRGLRGGDIEKTVAEYLK